MSVPRALDKLRSRLDEAIATYTQALVNGGFKTLDQVTQMQGAITGLLFAVQQLDEIRQTYLEDDDADDA